MSRRRRLHDPGERGASAVEFALVLPALLLILFSIMEYGWYLTQQMALVNATATGARTAVKAREWDLNNPQDPSELARLAVRNSFNFSYIPDSAITADDEFHAIQNGPRMMEVKVVDVEVKTLTGYLPGALLPKRMSARAVMAFP